MITKHKIGGREATVVYLTMAFVPTTEAKAELIKIIYDDGEMKFAVPTSKIEESNVISESTRHPFCPKCNPNKEGSGNSWDVHFLDDEGNEYLHRECRNCHHKEPIKKRYSKKREERNKRSEATLQSLLKKEETGMKTFKDFINEDGVSAAPVNTAGGGGIAGIGVGPQGEPGVKRKKPLVIKRKITEHRRKLTPHEEEAERIYKLIKDAELSCPSAYSYKLSTVQGHQKFVGDRRKAIEQAVGIKFTNRQIITAFTSDRMRTAMDRWDYLTDIVMKKTTNLKEMVAPATSHNVKAEFDYINGFVHGYTGKESSKGNPHYLKGFTHGHETKANHKRDEAYEPVAASRHALEAWKSYRIN